MLRVLIAEDEPLLALALKTQLAARGLQVVGIARDGQEAVACNREQHPDAILMDLRMPVMDGIEATRQIMAESPTCIVVLSAWSERDFITRARAAGAKAYLLKPARAEDIVRTLVAVAEASASCREPGP